MNNYFNLQRFGYLLRLEFFTRWRSMILPTIIVFFTPLCILSLSILNGEGSFNFIRYFIFSQFIWCCIEASHAFNTLHRENEIMPLLLLPASIFEKTLVRFLFYSIILPLVISILVIVSNLIGELMLFVVYGGYYEPMNLINNGLLEIIMSVIVLQSFFFLGSVWFRKAHFFRTFFSILGIGFVLAIILIVILYILFSYYLDIMELKDFIILKMEEAGLWREYVFLVPAPICWVLTWLRLRKIQNKRT